MGIGHGDLAVKQCSTEAALVRFEIRDVECFHRLVEVQLEVLFLG